MLEIISKKHVFDLLKRLTHLYATYESDLKQLKSMYPTGHESDLGKELLDFINTETVAIGNLADTAEQEEGPPDEKDTVPSLTHIIAEEMSDLFEIIYNASGIRLEGLPIIQELGAALEARYEKTPGKGLVDREVIGDRYLRVRMSFNHQFDIWSSTLCKLIKQRQIKGTTFGGEMRKRLDGIICYLARLNLLTDSDNFNKAIGSLGRIMELLQPVEKSSIPEEDLPLKEWSPEEMRSALDVEVSFRKENGTDYPEVMGLLSRLKRMMEVEALADTITTLDVEDAKAISNILRYRVLSPYRKQ